MLCSGLKHSAGTVLLSLVNMVTWELCIYQELGAPCTCLRVCSNVGAYWSCAVPQIDREIPVPTLWASADTGLLSVSPACVVSHSLFKELPKFMRKCLVLPLLQIQKVNSSSWVSGFQCQGDHFIGQPYLQTLGRKHLFSKFWPNLFPWSHLSNLSSVGVTT